MENSVQPSDDPHLQALLALYRQYGHELQVILRLVFILKFPILDRRGSE